MHRFTGSVSKSRKNTDLFIARGVKNSPAMRYSFIDRVVVLADMQEINSFWHNSRGPCDTEKDAGTMVIRRLVRQNVGSLHILRDRARPADHFGAIVGSDQD